MNGKQTELSGIKIPKRLISDLLQHWKINPNDLGRQGLLSYSILDNQSASAIEWLDARSPEENDWLKKILVLCASTIEVADVVFCYGNQYIDSLVVYYSGNNGQNQVVIQKADDFNLYFEWHSEWDTMEEMIHQHLLYCGPLNDSDLSFKFSRNEIGTFFACCDLERQNYMLSMVHHATPSDSIALEKLFDILVIKPEVTDIRWLYPFFSAFFTGDKSFEKHDIASALPALLKHDLINSIDEKGYFKLSESGKILSYAFNNSHLRAGISTALLIKSGPVISSRMFFIRTTGQVWLVIENPNEPGSFLMTSVDGKKLREILREAFIVPAESLKILAEPPKKQEIFCTECGEPLPVSAKFCRKCGNAVHKSGNI